MAWSISPGESCRVMRPRSTARGSKGAVPRSVPLAWSTAIWSTSVYCFFFLGSSTA